MWFTVLIYTGVTLKTCKGEEHFYVILGPYCGDLQELYMISRHYSSNYGKISNGCNICDIKGRDLGNIGYTGEITKQSESDTAIQGAIEAIYTGNKKDINEKLENLRELSLHPVPVSYCMHCSSLI
jgi:hypothetical protein